MYTFDTTNTETWGQFFSSLNLVDSVTFWLIEYDDFWSQMLRDIYFLLPRHSPRVPWVTIEDIWPHCDVTSMSRGQGSHRGQQPQLTQVFQTCPLTTKGMKAPPECPLLCLNISQVSQLTAHRAEKLTIWSYINSPSTQHWD